MPFRSLTVYLPRDIQPKIAPFIFLSWNSLPLPPAFAIGMS